MKPSLAILSIIIMTITLAGLARAGIPRGKLIFQDDFSEGTGKWINGDKGRVADGWFHLRGKHQVLHRVAVKGSGDWTDYVVEFDLKVINAIASWMVRCELNPEPSRYYLFCFNGREFQRNIKLEANRGAGETTLRNPVRHGDTARVTIVVQGDTIKHYIDGELIDTMKDGSLLRGGFGFRQMNYEEGAFANVKVYVNPTAAEAVESAATGPVPTPVASIPFVSKPPNLDGEIKEDEWAEAARLTGFSDLTGKLARQQTAAWISWDDENIYFAFESNKRFARNIPPRERDDARLFGNDAIEINLQPAGGQWAKLAFDFVGSQWDRMFSGTQVVTAPWNPDWMVANHIINDEFYVKDIWQCEVKVPFASLGVSPPAPGDRWSVQLCRDFDDSRDLGYPVGERWTSWSSATEGGFNEPSTFGTFRWVKERPAFQLDGYPDMAKGTAGFHGRLTSAGPAGCLAKLHAVLAGRNEDPLVQRETSLDAAPGPVPVAIEAGMDLAEIADVLVTWSVIDSDDGAIIARAAARTECVPSFALTYAPLFSEEMMIIESDLSRMSGLPAEATLSVSVTDEAGNVLRSSEHAVTSANPSIRIHQDLSGVPPGKHHIQVTMIDEGGKTLASSVRPLNVPEEPEWMKTDAGALEHVPPPWTPVELDQQRKATVIKTWGKSYRYEGGMLPQQIGIRGKDRLASPAELVLVTDRGRERLRFKPPNISDTSELGTTLRWTGGSKRFVVESEARVEFDGLIWNETRIRPRDGEVKILEAYLEIPYRKQGLRYMRGEDSMDFMKSHAYISMIGEARLDHDVPVPAENPNFSVKGWPWQDRFINFYWVGGLDFGVFAVLPSMKNTHIEERYNDLVEEGDRCLFRMYFIDHPTTLTEETQFAYGLQGTPTRPMRNRSQMNRTGYNVINKLTWDYFNHEITRHWEGATIDKFFTGPKIDPQKGDFYARYIQGSTLVNHGNAQPSAKDLDSIRGGVRLAHNLGAKAVLWLDLTYTPISLPHEVPYKFEWEQYPKQRQIYHGEEQTLVCPKSRSWKNFYLGNLDRLMKEEGVDGVYLDMTGPGSCNNHYHDCGYEAGGEWKGEIAFLDLRELFLRLYNVVHANDPEGIVFYHSNSWNPTVLYCDIDTKGEGWARAEDYSTFSLPYYQAGYMFQHQYNIAHNYFSTLCYVGYSGNPQRTLALAECVGLGLVHDTLPCVSTSLEAVGMLTVWNALDDFGAYDPGTVWTPYWESGLGDWQDGIAVSTYRNPAGDHFLVIFNTDVDESHTMKLVLRDFGAKSSYDVIAGTRSGDDTLHIDLPPRDTRLLRLNAQNP